MAGKMATPSGPPTTLTPTESSALAFWSLYGRRGRTPHRRTHPQSWDNLQPFHPLQPPRTLPWRIPIAAHQLPLLLKGFLPIEKDTSPFLTALNSGDYQPGDWFSNVGFLSTSNNPKNKATEDKWFVYAEGPDARGEARVCMHRSWTGVKVIELRLRVGGSLEGTASAWITHITWQPEANLSVEADEEAVKVKALTVCDWVLGVDLEVDGLQSVAKAPAVPWDQMAALLENVTNRSPRVNGLTTRIG